MICTTERLFEMARNDAFNSKLKSFLYSFHLILEFSLIGVHSSVIMSKIRKSFKEENSLSALDILYSLGYYVFDIDSCKVIFLLTMLHGITALHRC